MDNIQIAGWSGVYEILLILLVVIFIFNGLLRNKVLSKINDNLDQSKSSKNNKKPSKSKKVEGEYVDYEVVDEG